MALSIRPAADVDREAIWTVHVRAIREVCSRAYSADQIAAWAALLSPDSYAAVVHEQFVVVAEDTSGVVGFGQLNKANAEVDAVYVLPGRHGAGIGTAVLRSLEAAARSAGLGMLYLSATLNAVPFYERAGYIAEGPIAHQLPSGVELQCLRMSKRLARVE